MFNKVNHVQDFTLKYKADTFEFIEKLLNQENKDVPMTYSMLALMGFLYGKRISLNAEHSRGDSRREFSIRTTYNRYSNDYDSYIGIITILENKDLSYNEVVNEIAFQRTGEKNDPDFVSFLQMENVKTFFEYMIGGIDVFEEKILNKYGNQVVDIADAIDDFLFNDEKEIEELMTELILEEELELKEE